MPKSKVKSKSKTSKDTGNSRIGFIGAGKVTESIINGLVIFGNVNPNRIYVSAPSLTNTDRLKSYHHGLKTTKRNLDIFAKFDCEIVFIAVNGNVMLNLYKLGGIRPAPITTNYIPNMKHRLFVLSLVTGYDIKAIKDVLLNPEHPDSYDLEAHRIVMNCGAGYGMGICAIDCDPDDSKKLGQPVRSLLSLVAKLEFVPEKEMDAACAVCGAGLAFSYYFINALSDGALKIGLDRIEAVKFVAKTVNCATQTLLESRKHPNELKSEICAPSGAAIYGLTLLDKADVASGITGAVETAHKRALSLAKDENPDLKKE